MAPDTVSRPVLRSVLPGAGEGAVLASEEPLSFWGGVDPATGRVIDVHHPLHGESMAGKVLLLPSTRGSCTGSGVFLDMALNGHAPAAVIFSGAEDVVTLGALIAAEMFARPVPVLCAEWETWQALARAPRLAIRGVAVTGDSTGSITGSITGPGIALTIPPAPPAPLALGARDQAMLAGAEGEAVALAMRMIVKMAEEQGATELIDVTRGHIDGCIYASPANLTFAETMAGMGARVRIPTTMNAISVDRQNWRTQDVPPDFGLPAERLADAYVRMGAQPSFTCSPYLLDAPPALGEPIAWAESNAVIYANSVLGARTTKHPDFLDLCIAMTGRAPRSGVYLDENRRAQRVIDVHLPDAVDDAFWPLLGWLAGKASPDRIPLLRGLAPARPGTEALKALCAAFGTTSAAPMLHVEGVTPEADQIAPEADRVTLDRAAMRRAWEELNAGPEAVELVAIGSPHASLEECRALDRALAGHRAVIPLIVTAGRQVLEAARREGLFQRLAGLGVTLLPDLCWCSISEPVFPPETRALMTNSGKYAHYGPALSGRKVRFGSLQACAEAAVTGRAPRALPDWLH